MEKGKKNILLTVILTIFSIVYIVLVKNFNVRNVGPRNSSIGFSNINQFFKDLIGTNMTIYKITEILGLVALLIALVYAVIGIIQLVKRKSLLKVDKKIISLGILYILVIIMYILFEKFIVNYRPVILEGELEASFPSSHTMMAICICISAITMNKIYIKNIKYRKIANISCLILMLLIIIGRFISGVHWFSDIIGGLIISTTLLSYYYTIDYYLEKNE